MQIKRRQKIAKNQLKNFCRDANGDTGTGISHAHHALRPSPSASPLPALYTHSRYRMSDKRNSKRKEEEEEKQLEKNGKKLRAKSAGSLRDSHWPNVPKCTSRHAHGHGLSMELRIQMSLYLSPSLSYRLRVQVCAMYVSSEGFELGFAATMRANVTNKTQRCEIKNDIRIQIE